MTTKLRRVAQIAFIVAMLYPSLAFSESAEEMLGVCKPIAEAKVIDEHVYLDATSEKCWGAFIVLQEESGWVDSAHHRVLGACVPADATRTELVATFVGYVERHPESRHDDFVDVALKSLQATYECPSK